MTPEKSRGRKSTEQQSEPFNKLRAEFEKYRNRVASAAPMGAMPGFTQGAGLPPGAIPVWTFPPTAQPAGAPFGATVPGGTPATAEMVADRLGTTLRLGLDALTAGLAGAVRVLGNLSDIGYGLGAAAHQGWGGYGGHGYGHGHGCGCEYGCGCGHSSRTDCCGYDCCSILGADPCCRPGVGSCC